ncbi:MAG: hypothetical protein JNL60_06640 [Bacteroidia bacterium]|nr:hypothetical protein [Bacteroidia bacterium]
MKKIVLLLFVLSLAVSCKKNQLGGKSSVHGKVAHHSRVIPYATVFIKFNAKEFPGEDTTVYDDKVRADVNGEYSFKCYKGDYYLYGYGFDYAIAAPHIVVGGTPVRVHSRDDIEIEVAVSED